MFVQLVLYVRKDSFLRPKATIYFSSNKPWQGFHLRPLGVTRIVTDTQPFDGEELRSTSTCCRGLQLYLVRFKADAPYDQSERQVESKSVKPLTSRLSFCQMSMIALARG